MNEMVMERFPRSRKGFKQPTGQAELWILPQDLNPKVREYSEQVQKPIEGGNWLDRPEIPSSSEVLDIDTTGGSTSSGDVELVPNRPKGPWSSKEEYLGAMYELLREDAIRPLREDVSQVRITPAAKEEAFNGAIGIYEKVHICGYTCSSRGMALRVTFSLFRTGKLVKWDQSKRLITGSLVVLTPREDMFKTKAIVATVAARPLAALQQNPPEIDLFIARAEEQEIDPAQEFVMVEDRGGLYEADRHTLLALQRMMHEPFPLHEHLVDVKASVSAPKYIEEQPKMDLTRVLVKNEHETYENVDILSRWPAQPRSDLDPSQLAALRRILSKRLAIVQGPPGTGKTYVSVQTIKIMLANGKKDDPPIIVACQTNHAVDQLLNQIAKVEPDEPEVDFVRLGGRSKDQGKVKARTLYEVRQLTSENPLAGSLGPGSRKKMKDLENEVSLIMTPMTQDNKQPIDFRLLEKLGIITNHQADTLEAGASQWVQAQLSNPNEARSPFTVWLGKKLVSVPHKQLPENFGFDFEEADLEMEQIKDAEAETVAKDDEDFESLPGECRSIADNFTCHKVTGTTDAKIQEAMRQQNMWKIPEAIRPAVYRYIQAKLKQAILDGFRKKTKEFNELAIKRRIGRWEQDETILKRQKVIGMTTTGFSKYRGLIAALEPKIVLIEEAGETLEAPVTVTCLPSLQHLILVGDHKQLRPHCHVKAHEDKPWYLNISLFERMVKNKVEYDTLSKQRRMIPEIRRVLYPIYKDLIEDHESVLNPENRPPVPGMGGVNSFFFTHQWPEQRDEQMSAYNPNEVDMIVGLVEYLIYNGVESKDITILTFYNGQRKKLRSELSKRETLAGESFKVVTVDSYQGEENKYVILSLVRSNDNKQMGFLNIDNRVCVALSRAERGFYIFGNSTLLKEHPTWQKVIDIMTGKSKKNRLLVEPVSRLEKIFPVRCSNHNKTTEITDPGDWSNINGGCDSKCHGSLPCGHPCPLLCHPFPHDTVICRHECGKILSCCSGECKQECGEACVCKVCNKRKAPAQIAYIPAEEFDGEETLQPASTHSSWTSFSEREPGRYSNAAASAAASNRTSPEKAANTLLDLAPSDKMKDLSLGFEGTSPVTFGEPELSKDGRTKKWTDKFGSGGVEAKHEKDWSKESSLLD